MDGEGGGRQAGREGHDLRVTVAEHPLVDALVQRGVVGGVLDRRCWEAERRRNRDDLPPEVAHDRGRSVLALLFMQGTRGATLPLALEEPARLAGRDGDGEAGRGRAEDRLGGIVEAPRELDEAVPHERRFADEQVARLGVPPIPARDRAPDPQADGLPDHRVGDPVHGGIGPRRPAGFKNGPCDVPLQQVHGAPGCLRQVRELVDQQALSGAGEPGEEHHAAVARQPPQLVVQTRVRPCDETIGCVLHASPGR